MNKKRKRILFLVDNQNWCWTQQAINTAANLPEYDSIVVTEKDFRTNCKELLVSCDLVYLRGYPHILLRGAGMIDKPFIWTLSTGGANLQMRIEQSLKYKESAAACVVQNKMAEKHAKLNGFKNVTLIPCAVDTDKFSPGTQRPEFVVGFAGNNRGARGDLKGSTFVKAACEKLGITYREATLENKLTPDEMPDFYRSVMIYAQPSAAEGSSNSVMEAMACGKPCLIVKGVGYHGEVCENSKNVLFVERNVDSIIKAIRTLIVSGLTRENISNNALIFAEQHSWGSSIDKYRKLINKVM